MHHSRIRPAHDWEGAIHPFQCSCAECAISRDPIGHSHARRVVRLQAVLLITFAVGIYALVAANLPAIVDALGSR